MAAATQRTFTNVTAPNSQFTDSINVGENGSVVLHVEPGETLSGQSPPAYNVNLQMLVGGGWADVESITSALRDPSGNPLNFRIMERLPTGAAIRGEVVSTARGSSTVYLVT